MEEDKIKEFIFNWNNAFPLDRIYREKYKIPFNSKKHRKLCQIDIVIDLLEDILFREHLQKQVELQKQIQQYQESGRIFSISELDEDERFNKFIPLRPDDFRNIKDSSNNG